MPKPTEYPLITPTLIEALRKDFPKLVFTAAKPVEHNDFVFNGGQQSLIDKLEAVMKNQQKKNTGVHI